MKTELAVELRPLDDLIPYARNARTHGDAQVAQIAGSIREYGWTNPVLVDEAGTIIAGHGRVLAARQLGMAEVPVIALTHLTEAQKRALRLADNRLPLNAGWDTEMLGIELRDLAGAGFELAELGFEPPEIDAALGGDDGGDGPEEFAAYDEMIETKHTCPKCGYEWS